MAISMRSLLQTLLGLALASCALAANAQPALQEPADARFLSFAELYRMTVGGEPALQLPSTAEGMQIKLASAAPAAEASPRPLFSFSSAQLPGSSSRGVLLLSGLALAAWVARRRLAVTL